MDKSKSERLKDDIVQLCDEIPPGHYRLYVHPFPEFLPKVGRHHNNIALVARPVLDQPLIVDGRPLRDTVFAYCFIRDDRDKRDDSSTKHVNVNYRILGLDSNGDVCQESFVREDHYIPFVNCSTSMASIMQNRNLTGLPESAPISELTKRGVLLNVGKADLEKL